MRTSVVTSQTLHAFSVDVEDWYQSSYDLTAPISEICVKNTQNILRFLSERDVHGTFFVQGLVAKAFPHLISEIHANGHEIQSHGFSHYPVSEMTPKQFLSEIRETSHRLEDITGESVTGYRAPDFSIDDRCNWAFEVLIEAGITYDSSVFPVKTRRYGIRGFENGYSIIRTASGTIEELTVSVYQITRTLRIPLGGGGYIRLLPLWFLKFCLNRFVEQARPYVIYCHPYEFNPAEWDHIVKHVALSRKLHQSIGRRKFPHKISALLETASFAPISCVLDNIRVEGARRSCG